MPNEVLVFSPWKTQRSMPSSCTTLGASSSHFFGTWFSYMLGGSIMWSSILTRIMSSRFMVCSSPDGIVWATSRRAHRQGLPTTDGRGVGPLGLVVVDLPFGEAVQPLVERDPSLQPRQRSAEAEVDAVAEGLVAADLAADVEAVPLGKVAFVAVGRAVQQHHDAALGHRLAVELDVSGDVTGLHGRGRLEAQQLLDGVVDERPVGHQLGPLVRMATQDLAGEADQAGRGLVPGAGQQADVGEDLAVGQ